ncbi:MAG TPA: hypothetical protein VGX28_13730 [Frankiaceae bacterium]|jgi:hypothetical protein|nr:hypothetical protein [Frankiaceae bacterium]
MYLADAPQLLDDPIDLLVNKLPWGFFMVVHLALFAIGAYFAWRAFEATQSLAGGGFTLFALAEVMYMTYHVNITTFLFAHTVAEVLDGLAFVMLFVWATRTGLSRLPAGSSSRTSAGAAR